MAGRKKAKKALKVVTPSEEVTEYVNNSKDMAFSFAERIKKRHQKAQAALDAIPGIKLTRRPTTRARGESTLAFPENDLKEFRKRLVALRQQASGESSMLRNIALEQSDDRGRDEEDGSDVTMRLQNLGQVDSRNKVIQKIDEALHRIDEGTYGICEICGKLIRKPRLMNLPFVHTCMECQTAMEKRS